MFLELTDYITGRKFFIRITNETTLRFTEIDKLSFLDKEFTKEGYNDSGTQVSTLDGRPLFKVRETMVQIQSIFDPTKQAAALIEKLQGLAKTIK